MGQQKSKQITTAIATPTRPKKSTIYSQMCRAITATKTTISKIPTMRKRRRVRFSAVPSPPATTSHAVNDESSRVFEPRPFLSEEEIRSRWYSRNDEKSFKHDVMREMYFYTKGVQNGADPAICPRGIEKHNRQRRIHKKRILDLVLVAHRNGLDSERLAQFSRQRTRWNKVIASTQGHLDRVVVFRESQKER